MSRLRALLLAGALVVAAACGGDDDPTPAGNPTTTAASGTSVSTPGTPTSTGATTTVPSPKGDEAAGIDLPRSGVYAHLVVTLTEAELSNDTPGTRLDAEPETGDQRYLYLAYAMDFEPGYPGTSEELAVADVALELADGTVLGAEMVGFGRTVLVQPDRPASGAFAFAGSDLDLQGAALVLDDGVHEPLSIPLTGPAPDDPYPIEVVVDASADVTYEGGCTDATGSVTVASAAWDLDAGVDEAGEAIRSSGPKRAERDTRFVRVRIRGTAASGTCGGTVFDDEAFRLFADGTGPIESENAYVTELDNGESTDIVLGYVVPVDVADLVLVAGTPEGTTARLPIPVPDPLP